MTNSQEDQTEIGKLKKKDLAELLLIGRVYFEDTDWFDEGYLKALDKVALAKMVIRLQGRLIGGAMVTADKTPNVVLEFMVVDKNFGRQGFGENLFMAVERSLEAGQRLWYFAQDNKKFAPTRKFLLKMGMEQSGHLHGYYDGTDAVAYSKLVR